MDIAHAYKEQYIIQRITIYLLSCLDVSIYHLHTIQHLPLGNVMFTGSVNKDGCGQEQSEMKL